MSDLSRFLKKNKKTKSNTKYIATKSLTDEKGNPLEWEIRPISTKQNDELRDSCTTEVQVTGKPNVFRQKVNATQYIAKMIASAVEFPNLQNAELQDSYGVATPEALIKEMVDDPGEYNDLAAFVQQFNGFDVSMDEKVEEAKN